MSDDKKHFSNELNKILSQSNVSQSALSRELGVSRAYVSYLATGKKQPSAERADEIADAVKASDEDRTKLHVAAARDLGFKINFPDDF
jgi:transcriptional regulator with XRE-family HTH domain